VPADPSRRPGHRWHRPRTNSHPSRVGRPGLHAIAATTPDEPRPTLSPLLISAKPSRPHQPSRRISRSNRSRPQRTTHIESLASAHQPRRSHHYHRSSTGAGDSQRKRRVSHAFPHSARHHFPPPHHARRPRRRPRLHRRLRLQSRSRRQSAPLGQRLRPVLHRPGQPQPHSHRRSGRRFRRNRFQLLDHNPRRIPRRRPSWPSRRRRKRQQYRNQRPGHCHRSRRHHLLRHRHSRRNCLRLRWHRNRHHPWPGRRRFGILLHQRRLRRTRQFLRRRKHRARPGRHQRNLRLHHRPTPRRAIPPRPPARTHSRSRLVAGQPQRRNREPSPHRRRLCRIPRHALCRSHQLRPHQHLLSQPRPPQNG